MTTVPSVSESVRQRLTAVLFTGQSFFSAGMIATFTLMAIIAADLSGNVATAGIPSTLTLLGRAFAAYPIGVLMDKAGRRIGLSVGFGLALAGCVIAIWAIIAGTFIGFCLGAAFMGMGRAATDQSRYVAAEVYAADKRAKVIGFIVFAGTIGAVFGPALVTPSLSIAQLIGLPEMTGPFLIGILLYFLGLIITFFLLRPDPKMIGALVDSAEHHTTQTAPARPLTKIFQQPTVILAVAAMIIGQLVMALIMVITPLHMDHQSHSTTSISFVISAHTFGMFALSGVTGWLIDRFGRIPLIIVGALVLIAASLLTATSTTVGTLAFALFLLGLGWNFCFIAGSSLLSDSLFASERARTQGLSEMLVALAAGLAGLLTGVLFDSAGITAVSAVALGFSLVIFGFLLLYGLSKRQIKQPIENVKDF